MDPLGRMGLSLLLITLFSILCLSSCTDVPKAEGVVVSVEKKAEFCPWSNPQITTAFVTKAENRGYGAKSRKVTRILHFYPKEVTLNKVWRAGGKRSFGVGEAKGSFLMRCFENKNLQEFKASIYHRMTDGDPAWFVLLTVKVPSCDPQILTSITVTSENDTKSHKVMLYFKNKECREYKFDSESPKEEENNSEDLTEEECSRKTNMNGWKDVTGNSKYEFKNEKQEE